MTETVVGVFNSSEEARRARQELIANGFDEADLSLQSHPADSSGGTLVSDQPENHEGFMASVRDFFSDLFGDADSTDAGHYAEAVRRGRAVLTVQARDGAAAQQAQSALASAGAVNLDALTESWRGQGYSSFDNSAKPYTAEQISAERGTVVPVLKEELEVGTREVDLGTVRVYSRTVEVPVSETVQLREQHAEIQRRPVDRTATAADLEAFEGGSVEVRETAERPVVSKQARVVEEVVVGTASRTTEQTIDDSVRSTVVEVEKGRQRQAGSDKVDPRYQAHFQQNFAANGSRYEDFAPAYAFGSQLRSDGRYEKSDWASVEADAQRDWSSRHPATAWDQVKSAVRHGWDAATR